MKITHKDKLRGFTLVEILIVISIIIILISGLVVAVMGMVERAKEKKTTALIQILSEAIEQYKSATGFYPKITNGERQQNSVELTTVLTGVFTVGGKEVGPFLKQEDLSKVATLGETEGESSGFEIMDAWGQGVIYRCPGTDWPTVVKADIPDKLKWRDTTKKFDLYSLGENGTDDTSSEEGAYDDIGTHNIQ